MKKQIGLCICISFVLVAVYLPQLKQVKSFYLEDKYYGVNQVTEITQEQLKNLINGKESFAVFVYQPSCVTSSDFESVVLDFLEEQQIQIYKIAFSEIKDTDIGKKIKYYPSFMLYKGGKLIDFLEADKDEDVAYYSSKEGFQTWFTRYVKLKDLTEEKQPTPPIDEKDEPVESKEINLEHVVKEENKVNIYFFWGRGCPHCEEEFAFFESIKAQYGAYYNLYSFETWYNKENAELLHVFASYMKDTVKGVPYTIIGSQSFKGFADTKKNDFIHAIESQYQDSYDVYFDEIKKEVNS